METDLLLVTGGAAAGLFGSLLGLGGGTLIVPLLTLAFNVPLREAVGVSLVCVIVTSSASAGVYLQRRVANLRLGMTLELFTATGALVGGLVAVLLAERLLAGLFAVLLAYVAVSMMWRREPEPSDIPGTAEPPVEPVATGWSTLGPVLGLAGPGYVAGNLAWGVLGSLGAGIVSALLGIGGGLVKVPVMHLVMGVPLRVATATSNLMIGITASAGAIVYLLRGQIDAYLAGVVAVGVFAGAAAGSRLAHRIDVRYLRLLFVVVLLYTGVQMARRALAL